MIHEEDKVPNEASRVRSHEEEKRSPSANPRLDEPAFQDQVSARILAESDKESLIKAIRESRYRLQHLFAFGRLSLLSEKKLHWIDDRPEGVMFAYNTLFNDAA